MILFIGIILLYNQTSIQYNTLEPPPLPPIYPASVPLVEGGQGIPGYPDKLIIKG